MNIKLDSLYIDENVQIYEKHQHMGECQQTNDSFCLNFILIWLWFDV